MIKRIDKRFIDWSKNCFNLLGLDQRNFQMMVIRTLKIKTGLRAELARLAGSWTPVTR